MAHHGSRAGAALGHEAAAPTAAIGNVHSSGSHAPGHAFAAAASSVDGQDHLNKRLVRNSGTACSGRRSCAGKR